MSVSYYAYSLIGYRIDMSDFLEEKNQCDHKIPANAKFCPTCGKKVEVIEDDKALCDFKYFLEDLERDGASGLVGVIDPDDDDFCFVGYGIQTSDDNGESKGVPCLDADSIKTKINAALAEYREHISLSEDDFGLWSVLYCSC